MNQEEEVSMIQAQSKPDANINLEIQKTIFFNPHKT
jgi:hypothetical protein